MVVIHECDRAKYIKIDPCNLPDRAGLIYWQHFKYGTEDMYFGEYMGNNDTHCYNCGEELKDGQS